ncbi:transcriptional regulator [Afipia sp. P52-10]|nr:transcriptional regulator [Afipia sp. P52-10]
MSNKSNQAQHRFIEDMTRLLVPWGVPTTAARIYGYMLLAPAPVSLDQMADDLQISKSSASVAARLLEKYTLAYRQRVRGSKRVLYAVSDNYEAMLTEQNRLLDAMAALLQRGAETAASPVARTRLNAMGGFYLTVKSAMSSALKRQRAKERH